MRYQKAVLALGTLIGALIVTTAAVAEEQSVEIAAGTATMYFGMVLGLVATPLQEKYEEMKARFIKVASGERENAYPYSPLSDGSTGFTSIGSDAPEDLFMKEFREREMYLRPHSEAISAYCAKHEDKVVGVGARAKSGHLVELQGAANEHLGAFCWKLAAEIREECPVVSGPGAQ